MMFPLKNKPALLKQILIVFILALPVNGHATIVEMQTNEGNIDIQLYDTAAPKTVANFLSYVIKGDYNNSFIHRSVPGFVIQGGGYSWSNTTGAAIIPTEPPVVNEFKQSNVRGTIAMAKIGGQPNSATDQWFFNLADNSANLDGQNGGFTVFGQVINNGMQVVDKIAGLSVVNGCSKAALTVILAPYP